MKASVKQRQSVAARGDQAALRTLAWLLMLLSGFAGLACQVVWTQQLGIWLGHEIIAVLSVVAAFFCGIALGARWLGDRIALSRWPARWYGALETVIGLWALLLAVVLPDAGELLLRLTGSTPAPVWHWTVAFAGPLLLLLPATAAMGATLPAMERLLAQVRRDGYGIGGIYSANTFGAVAGALVPTFVIVPALGLRSAAVLAALASLGCALLAFRLLPALPGKPLAPAPAVRASASNRAILATLALTGFLGIGYEVVVVRALSQVAENTVYTYSLLLAVYLAGSAAGAAAWQRWLTGSGSAGMQRNVLLGVTALACVAGAFSLWLAGALKSWTIGYLGGGFGAALFAEGLVAAVAFVLPAIAMGALFTQLCVEAREQGWSLGRAIAANTMGACIAPLLVGVLLLPMLGVQYLLALLSAAYVLLLSWQGGRVTRRAGATAGAVAAGVAALLAAPALQLLEVPAGGRILSHREGVMAAVSVLEDVDGVRSLHINNRVQEGSSTTFMADARQAWLPLALHPAPRTALFLGLGTGVTAAAAAFDASLQVDAVELVPEVIAASDAFLPTLALQGISRVPRVLVADARRYVRAGSGHYDVIVADLFHPARSGSGSLYTVEHFAAVKRRVAAGGLFCQWLPLHQLDLDSLRSVVAAFRLVFTDSVAVLATHSLDTPVLGLVARMPTSGSIWPDPAGTPITSAAQQIRTQLQLDDWLAAYGTIVADDEALARFAAAAAANSDDRPIVSHRAPRLAYAADSGTRQRLQELLAAFHADPTRIFGPPGDEQGARRQQRLAAYWQARSRYLMAGMGVQPDPDPRRMLAQVEAPLLEVLRISPDFRSARDPLLAMAGALARTDPVAATALRARIADAGAAAATP
ncbi:MAG TPA: fused MFS/spermidine synthase [Steroidobacteraceae bacterium]|nr:fused MFS/spermidine synthase [Steroidobacteraceae bacterium]